MTIVRLKVARCGDYITQRPGDVVDLPAAEASRLIAEGQAEPVDDVDSLDDPQPVDVPPKPANRKATRAPKEKR